MSWIKDILNPDTRKWEDFYRNRWQHDKVVRSTHGVNCTGSCSWNIYVKNGLVAWELQALDYPKISKDLPPYEPRGCQRGISYSWYLYSPLRVKYPYVRGKLLDLWERAKADCAGDTVAAWQSIVSDPEMRRQYQQARGKGGLRRVSWDQAMEIVAAANIHTARTHGPDRIVGFSPIPAMSMVSYGAGARFLQLMGGVCLSFYDWYCDLPPASPEVWGEQTDVAESADWYASKLIAVVGANVLMTRTPDAHFLVEARHRGSKVVVFSPDFSQASKAADTWIPIHQGQDGAFWMAVGHVILKENYVDRSIPYFTDYQKQNTDSPFLVTLSRQPDGHYTAGRLLRASQLEATRNEENAEWKTFVLDEPTGKPVLPKGTLGYRWQSRKGEWNLKSETGGSSQPFSPALSLMDVKDDSVLVRVPDFSQGQNAVSVLRGVPVKRIETLQGPVYVTTVFDLLLAQYGVNRGLPGEWPADYTDAAAPYTPAWQEPFTGIQANAVMAFAREWAKTAELTRGQCSVIIGAGANHWYHNNLLYRAPIAVLMMTGCVGVNGGGLNHYVGQEKLAPMASWSPYAFAADWAGPPRLQNTPSFHYVHSDQWRYDGKFGDMTAVSDPDNRFAGGHTIDAQIRAVRNGWLPCYPQFNKPNHAIVEEARKSGAHSPEQIVAYIVEQLRTRRLKFSMEDPDNPDNFPRVWYIWRGNALMSSAKGHEYFLKHYLGTHTNSIADQVDPGSVREVTWHDKLPEGKMDLVVDLNFRMDTSALYADVVLPAATYYEKDDLNSTDMHTFIHPLQKAVNPSWEAKSDWEIFKTIAQHTSELAQKAMPHPLPDIVASPLMHDTPAEMAQPTVKEWCLGECEMIPGKTMPNLKVTERDIANVYNRFISLGPGVRQNGLGAHGLSFDVADVYDECLRTGPVVTWGGQTYPSLETDRNVCEYILAFAPETNGELAYRAFEAESHKTGLDLTPLATEGRGLRLRFDDLACQPRRYVTTPFWSGNITEGRAYSAYTINVEERVPWRTLTGRQHFYLDHEAYLAFGEQLPAYKTRIQPAQYGDLVKSGRERGALMLNFLTPHGKWGIHSTYGDTLTMRTLSRGHEPFWMNDSDAERAGIRDNDWVEVFNDHGVVITRACVSARLPTGICMIYHSPERTLGVPKSELRGRKRAGGHNSLTRIRLKPLLMVGGYAQFTYAFNYWGPTGVNRETTVMVRKLERVLW